MNIQLPTTCSLIEAIAYEGPAATCPRCRRQAKRMLFFVRAVDAGRAIIHCGCLTDQERATGHAPQTFKNQIDRAAWEKRIKLTIKGLT